MDKYELIVLGAGSGGLTAARTAAKLGARVAILEKSKIGGDCLHTGCVPSKSLISIARKLYAQKSLQIFRQGQSLTSWEVDYGAIRRAVQSNQQVIVDATDNEQALADIGITTIRGEFAFQDAHTLRSTDGTSVRFKKCIIASGSQPREPEIPGIEDVAYLTSDTIWDMAAIPDTLAVIGGGPIGLELGQAFAMLGSKVTIFERGERLVPRFDTDISRRLQDGLEASGVKIIFSSSVERVDQQNEGAVVTYKQDDTTRKLPVSKLLVAIGRVPHTAGLGLEKAAVDLCERGGIQTDSKQRTTQKHIYAVGDCLGGPLFTHWAAEQGANAALHAALGIARGLNANALPSATFTTPEIGQVGAAEQQLQSDKTEYKKLTIPYSDIDKAIAEQEHGVITVLIDAKRRVLGAAIVGNNAAELIGYFSVLIAKKRAFDDLAGPIQPYPTYAMAIKQTAGEKRLSDFGASWLGRLLRTFRS